MKAAGAGTAAMGAAGIGGGGAAAARDFKISLAAWSLHRTIGTGPGKTPMLDMPKLARQEWDIEAIELVNHMLAEHEKEFAAMKGYLDRLAKNAADHSVKILLIMVDGQGSIGGEAEPERERAVAQHKKWIDIAEYLGCHSIRMNWAGAAKSVEKDAAVLKTFVDRSVPGFHNLCDYGDSKNIDVLIENHGGPSSDPAAMETLMTAVNHPRFGTLPDFGNFPPGTDIYDGIDRLMKFAKAVSAKCHDFDENRGEETTKDFARLLDIVVGKHGYHGYIGIEYEGDRMSEFDGIKACNELLKKLRT